jgi:hypothetical protein
MINKWVDQGLSVAEIARRVGTTPNSLKVTCSHLGVPLVRKSMRIDLRRVDDHALLLARAYADRTGRTLSELVVKLIEVIGTDDLFSAVLDEKLKSDRQAL